MLVPVCASVYTHLRVAQTAGYGSTLHILPTTFRKSSSHRDYEANRTAFLAAASDARSHVGSHRCGVIAQPSLSGGGMPAPVILITYECA